MYVFEIQRLKQTQPLQTASIVKLSKFDIPRTSQNIIMFIQFALQYLAISVNQGHSELSQVEVNFPNVFRHTYTTKSSCSLHFYNTC